MQAKCEKESLKLGSHRLLHCPGSLGKGVRLTRRELTLAGVVDAWVACSQHWPTSRMS